MIGINITLCRKYDVMKAKLTEIALVKGSTPAALGFMDAIVDIGKN